MKPPSEADKFQWAGGVLEVVFNCERDEVPALHMPKHIATLGNFSATAFTADEAVLRVHRQINLAKRQLEMRVLSRIT